jgi:hypothetical protein
MMVSALEPAALSSLPAGAELGEGSIVSTPEKGLEFPARGVGKAKRAHASVGYAGKGRVGTAQNAPLPGPRFFFRSPPRILDIPWLAGCNRKRRRAFYTAGETSIECAI